MPDLVISIRLKETVSRELKDWPKKRIAVEGMLSDCISRLYRTVTFNFSVYVLGY